MDQLINKRIVVGITGGIAAYKGAELVRRLKEAGAEVRVVMTPAATQFITPLTLQALSGQPVHVELLDATEESAMGHITLTRWADAVVVAPASADFMAKLAHGLAGDLLSTLCLASRAPLLLAPAMNSAMWENPATQANSQLLRERGVRLLGPADGGQACGEIGPGRMLEPPAIAAAVAQTFSSGALQGKTLLMTAGPTREAIDPVRFISNRSSGKMGYAVAQAAQEAGARVVLVSGPTALAPPARVERVVVESAAEMHAAVAARVAEADIFIGAAAVADYTTASAPHKIKKKEPRMTLELERTLDIVALVARRSPRPFTVAFAAETEALLEHAQEKLHAKNLDMVVANWVGRPGLGFDSDDNALTVLWRDGGVDWPAAGKIALARQLISLIAERYHAQHTS
ncbi:MAG: bifunctional phosphopantothenoylcysteine decarboxylase/phosphopantothenate--cysteine ligase CoaBC [Pseudomonadota bacterium]